MNAKTLTLIGLVAIALVALPAVSAAPGPQSENCGGLLGCNTLNNSSCLGVYHTDPKTGSTCIGLWNGP